MRTIYSPNNIEILLWCHTRCEPHPRSDAPAVKEAIGDFLKLGAIERDEEWYRTTPMGQAWVQALCNTPPPVVAYIDQNGAVIKST